MINVASIVEGDAEVEALPILLRRMAEWQSPKRVVEPLKPIRVYRGRFLNRPNEFRKHLLLAAAKCGVEGWILVLLDADDDCPSALGAEIMQKAREIVPHRRLSVVLANREFEAWFLAASRSLDGTRDFHVLADDLVDAESPRNAKGWMEQRMKRAYREMLDQPAFTAKFNLQQAFNGSRSFRKLCSEWRLHVQHRD